MKEIITVDGKQFATEYEGVLSPEQRDSVVRQIQAQIMSGCGGPCGQTNYALNGTIMSLPAVPYTDTFNYADVAAANAAGWTAFTATGGSATYSVDSTGRTDAKSLKIVGTTSGSYLYRWLGSNTFLPVTPGQTYYSSVWAKSTGGLAQYTITWMRNDGTAISTEAVVGTTSTTYSQLVINVAAPTGAAYARPDLRVTGTVTAWYDDFSFSATPPATTACPTFILNPGEVLKLDAKAQGGLAPYTVRFRKGASQATATDITTASGVAENTYTTYNYVILTSDPNPLYLDSYVTDSCSGNPAVIKSCSVSIATAACSIPVIDFVVTKV